MPLYIYAIGLLSLLTIFWEHTARLRGFQAKPSRGIRWAATQAARFFRAVGKALAWLSSFMTALEELKHTLADLLRPTVDLVTSFTHVAYGYFEKAGRYRYPVLILAGTAILVGCAWAAFSYFELTDAVREFILAAPPAYIFGEIMLALACAFRYFWPWRNILADDAPEEEEQTIPAVPAIHNSEEPKDE